MRMLRGPLSIITAPANKDAPLSLSLLSGPPCPLRVSFGIAAIAVTFLYSALTDAQRPCDASHASLTGSPRSLGTATATRHEGPWTPAALAGDLRLLAPDTSS
ncbi:hypothetical protein SHIRM173S_13164 [Streptomyces hirsutus]